MQQDLALHDAAGWVDELQDRACRHALAAAAFADDAQRLAALDGEIDGIDRAHGPFLKEEMGLEGAHVQDGVSSGHGDLRNNRFIIGTDRLRHAARHP
jgi:hypothetical protein